MFEQTIYNIKEVYRNYVSPELYDFSDAIDNKNDDGPLSLTTRTTTVSVAAESWF